MDTKVISSKEKATSRFLKYCKDFFRIKLASYMVFLVGFFCWIFFYFSYESLSEFTSIIMAVTKTSSTSDSIMFEYLDNLRLWLMCMIAIFFMLSLSICLIYTLRLSSQISLFKAHVKKLKDGKYQDKIQLKEGYVFSELANEMNQLTDQLAQENHQVDKRS